MMNNEAEALREKIGWYLDRYADGPTPRDRHAQAILTLCAKVAREAVENTEPMVEIYRNAVDKDDAIKAINKAFGVNDE